MVELKRPLMVDRTQIGMTEYWIVNIPQYCGKILYLKKGYTCPLHYHKDKHETFFIWKGKVEMEVDGEKVIMKPGDVLVMEQGKKHKFTALEEDAVIFEFSGEHKEEDSYFLEEGDKDKALKNVVIKEEYPWTF
ncbi:MAG: cupin domain-containing protein [Caldiserica bacterium]|nr:cupin domain-containing protein [Caldisericota bacterium]